MLVLYDKPECPFCWRVRMCLARVEADHELRSFDAPEWQAIWPSLSARGTVPVMVDGDLVMTDSRVMLEYLEDAYGGTLPLSAEGRARVRELILYTDEVLGPAARDLIFECRGKPPEQRDQALLADAQARWYAALPKLETLLGDQPWFVGRCSQADYALATRFALAQAYGMSLFDRDTPLRAWFERVMLREEVLNSAPPSVTQALARVSDL